MSKLPFTALQNYIEAWTETFKKPIDLTKIPDVVDEVGDTADYVRCDTLSHDDSSLSILTTSNDKYCKVRLNGKELFPEINFTYAKIAGNLVYVKRESDGKWNAINKNGNLVWGSWAEEVRFLLGGDALVKWEENFKIVDENGVVVAFDEDDDDIAENDFDDDDIEDDDFDDEDCEEDDDIENTECEASQPNEETSDAPKKPEEDKLILICTRQIDDMLTKFHDEPLPLIRKEVIDSAVELAELFCDDMYDNICYAVTDMVETAEKERIHIKQCGNNDYSLSTDDGRIGSLTNLVMTELKKRLG